MLEHGAHFFALGRLALAQYHHDRLAALDVIYVDPQKAAAILMAVPEGQLLTAMHFVDGVVDIEVIASGADGKLAQN
jgi:hypothetical protein